MIRRATFFGSVFVIGVLLLGVFSWYMTPALFAAEAHQPAAQIRPDDEDRRPDWRGKRLGGGLIRATAEVSGIEVAEVIEGLRNGQSLAQIAAANGSSGDAVVQQAVEQATERLDRAVANGRLTQAEADALLDKLTEEITRLVNDPTLGEKVAQVRETVLIGGLIRATANVSDIGIGEVLDKVRNGQSLAQIAAANDSSGDAVVQQVVDLRSALFDRAVAAGRLTQAEADEAIATLTDMATDLVNDTNLEAELDERLDRVKERHVRRALIQTTAEVTDLPARTVVERLRGGESLAEIAESAGSSGDAVVQTAVDNFRDIATQLVDETQ